MYPGLNICREPISKTKQGLHRIYISTLGVPFRKFYNLLSDITSLSPFGRGLPCFEGIVCWFEVPKQGSLKATPARHITLHLKPSVSLSIKQTYSNLPPLGVIFQICQVKVDVQLMKKLKGCGAIHLSMECWW